MSTSKTPQHKPLAARLSRALLAGAAVIALAPISQMTHAQTTLVVTAPIVDHAEQTAYPIVLVTGLTGSPVSATGAHYWFNMDTALAAHGAAVYVPDLSNFQGEEGPNGRGEELLKAVEAIVAETGAKKVNLIGHSQGGLSSRYVAYVRPDLVASVTTFDTPHWGTTVADLVQNLFNIDPTGIAENDVVGPLVNALFAQFGGGGQTDQDSAAALAQLTTAGTGQFDADIPSAGLGSFANCTTGSPTETLSYNGGTYTHTLWSVTGTAVQPTPLLVIPGYDDSEEIADPVIIESPEHDGLDTTGGYMLSQTISKPIQEPNDGVVSQCSAMFGNVLNKNYHWVHTDAVDSGGYLGAYAENPIQVILAQASRLKGLGD